jgi:hypothetical protein
VPKNNLQILAVDWIFGSTEKSKKIWSTDYETFDQLKKDNFNQVKFGQTTPCCQNQKQKQKRIIFTELMKISVARKTNEEQTTRKNENLKSNKLLLRFSLIWKP